MSGYPWAPGDELLANDLNAAISAASSSVAAGGPFLPISGVSPMTGPLTVGTGSGTQVLKLNGAAGAAKGFALQNAGTYRWQLITDAAEKLNVFAYDASGAFKGTAMWFANDASAIQMNFPFLFRATQAGIQGGVTGIDAIATNTGSNASQGFKFAYFSNASNTTGFDVGTTSLAVFDPSTPTAGRSPAYLANWMVSVAPNILHGYQAAVMEMDVVNRGPDTGWKRDRTLFGPTGVLLLVPEVVTFAGTGGGEGKNATYGLAFSRSGGTNSTGFSAKFYNAVMIEPNSTVGLTGRGIYATGDITAVASQIPYGPLQTDGTWLHGFDHTLATYQDNHASIMHPGQAIAWLVGTTASPTATATITGSGSGANASIVLAPAGTGTVHISSIPTSAAGLVAGDVWRNGTVLNIV